MRSDTIQSLLNINKEFYQSFGQAFAETRRRIQPGIVRALEEFIRDGDWLDLGCGSGALAQEWIMRGLKERYTGVDFSAALLEEAGRGLSQVKVPEGLKMQFIQADLLNENWATPFPLEQLDGVLAFAALHHIPGRVQRERLVRQAAGLLRPGGLFIHSQWQFQHSPRLLARVQPWSLAGIDEADLEPGDTLLDWRHTAGGSPGETGLRYVHLFNREELVDLADQGGFGLLAEYSSDGSGGKLGLYQVWKKLPA